MLSSVVDRASLANGYDLKNVAVPILSSISAMWMPKHILAPKPNGLNELLIASVISAPGSHRVTSNL